MNKKHIQAGVVILGLALIIGVMVYRYQTSKADSNLKGLHVIDKVEVPDVKLPEQKNKTELIEQLKRESTNSKHNANGLEYIQPINLLQLQSSLPISIVPPPQDAIERPVSNKGKPNAVGHHQPYNNPTQLVQLQSPQFQPTPTQSSSPQSSSPQSSSPTNPASISPSNASFGTLKNNPSTAKGETSANLEQFNAKVYGDHRLQQNTALVVRNTQEIHWNNETIPENSLFYGKAMFNGNRVAVLFNKVKTPLKEIFVRFAILDNDRIEGLFYRAPLDEVVDDSQDAVNTNLSPSNNYDLVNRISQGTLSKTKELLQKSRVLVLPEGYPVFLIPIADKMTKL